MSYFAVRLAAIPEKAWVVACETPAFAFSQTFVHDADSRGEWKQLDDATYRSWQMRQAALKDPQGWTTFADPRPK